jgi:hypothetical protein
MANTESQLLAQLSDISPDLLKQASKSIAYLQKSGYKIERGFPKGKYGPDRLVIQATISSDLIKDRLKGLLDIPFARRYDIFPYGIIADDLYRLRVEVGSKLSI